MQPTKQLIKKYQNLYVQIKNRAGDIIGEFRMKVPGSKTSSEVLESTNLTFLRESGLITFAEYNTEIENEGLITDVSVLLTVWG